MRSSHFLLFAIAAATLFACDKSPSAPTPVASVSVSPSSATLQVGQTQQMTASTLSSGGSALSGRVVSWTSSDVTVATVSATGLVTALKPASVSITATSETKTGTASLTVTPGALTTVQITLKDTVIVMGKTTTATAQLLDSAGFAISNIPVAYSSGDTNVALAGTSGVVTGVYEGTTTIRATANGKTGTAMIRILLDPTVAAAYWKAVPSAFPSINAYLTALGGGAGMQVAAVTDFNRDGRQDIALHLWHGLGQPFGQLVDIPVPNRLVVFLANADGTYRDGTADLFGTTTVDLAGATTRNVRIADLNNDGYSDLVYATNREDGRGCIPGFGGCSNQAALAVAVMSNGNGTYRVVTFGDAVYHHSVEIASRDATGFTLIYDFAEFATDGNVFVPTNDFPKRNISSFAVASTIPSGSTDVFIADVKQLTNATSPTGMRLYSRAGNGLWQATSDYFFPTWRVVDFVNWSGDLGQSYVVTLSGREHLAGAFYATCALRLTPKAAPLFISNYASALIPAAISGRSSYKESDGTPYSMLFAFRSDNSPLTPSPIISESESPENLNFIKCEDVNGDGYDDFVTYPYRSGARPNVYLNNRAGSLQKLSAFLLPDGPHSDAMTAQFVDSNGDGIMDLVYFPGNGCNAGDSCATFQLYRGRRPLQLPSTTRGSLRGSPLRAP